MTRQKNFKCFVIMPFGRSEEDKDKFNKVFSKGIQPTSNRIQEFEIIFYRADVNLEEFELIRSVHKNLNESDFCLADISGLNENVLYEIGYAKAKKKEIVVISQDSAPYPIDISNMIVTKYSAEKKEDLEVLSQKLAILMEKAIEFIQNKTYSIKDAYEIKCYQDRRIADLNNAFRNAKSRISILQTNLDTMINENYLDSLVQSLENNNQLNLRILTLDPDSYFAQKRAEQLGREIAHYRNELHASVKVTINRLNKFGGRFSLRIYDDFPTQITFIIDENVYTCTVARNVRSRELCTFMLNKFSTGVERSFLFHFDSIWSNARAYEAHTISEVEP